MVFMLLIYTYTNNLLYAWRVFFGPLSTFLAYISFISKQICVTFVIICITEIVVFKVIMIYAWKHYSIADETFIYRITILFNYALCIGLHFARLFLGTSGTLGFEILSGSFLQNILEKRYFWPIFFSLNAITIIFGCFLILIKKCKYSQISPEQNVNAAFNPNVNHHSHNEPMMNYIQIAWVTSTLMVIVALYILYYINDIQLEDDFSDHYSFFFTELIGKVISKVSHTFHELNRCIPILGEFCFSVVIPSYLLFKNEQMRNTFWNEYLAHIMNIEAF